MWKRAPKKKANDYLPTEQNSTTPNNYQYEACASL